MKYYVREIPYESQMRGAWGKARGDINAILEFMGFIPLSIQQSNHKDIHKYTRNIVYRDVWEKTLSILKQGDQLAVQYPPLENTVFLSQCLHRISQRGVKIILIVHDLIILVEKKGLKKLIYSITEPKVLNSVTKVIVHNDHMARRLKLDGSKLISLQIFDYLLPHLNKDKMDSDNIRKEKPIIIAGNLDPKKTQYLYHLPNECEFNLCGVGYIDDGRKNVHYQGSYAPDELPYALNGSFGLVWDGDSAESCIGKYGDYLKINNPHKTSLYLACGIPVVIWKQAAMADFILENQCGIAVESLFEIRERIDTMSEKEYKKLKINAQRIGQRLREGKFMEVAINTALI